jgi:trehalose-6-phosphatase
MVVERWADTADETSLELFEFDGGVEIRVAGTNKAVPVGQLLEESGNDTVAAYLGDDATDEDAFGAIKGRGLSVLVRGEQRETGADIWIQPPEELVAFLRRWL